MSAADDIETPRRRRPRILVALAIALVAALIGVWLARVPIATGFIDREFAANGVAVRYRVADLGFGRQRLTDVVIGDPAHPDLVADWIETHVDIGAGGPQLAGVHAGRVRLRGRVVGGRLSLGAIDRLLPAPSGSPFALPALDVAVDDGRLRLDTPAGLVGLRLSGRGRLDDGFRGQLALAADRLTAGGCTFAMLRAALTIRITRAAPSLVGPLRAAEVVCADTQITAPTATIDGTLGPALDHWAGQARLASPRVASTPVAVKGLRATVSFDGNANRTAGRAVLTSGVLVAARTSAATLAFDGTWRIAANRALAAGRWRASRITLAPAQRQAIGRLATGGAGTPVAPLAAQAGNALARAAAGFDAAGDLGIGTTNGRLFATIKRIDLSAPSGARATFSDGDGIVVGDPGGWGVDGTMTLAGGGLPDMRATLDQAAPGAPVSGLATFAPYAAGGARLALAPVHFVADGGGTRITTVADLSGPVGEGRVDRLRLPIEAHWDGAARLVVNPACTPLSVDRLAVAGLTLRPTKISLCPIAAALLTIDRGRIAGGAAIAALKLAGTLGGSPLTLAAAQAHIRPDGFTADRIAARIGSVGRVTRLDLGHLDGRFEHGGIAGNFAKTDGQIGNVPLSLSDVAGAWQVARGALTLAGTLTVADAAPDARFKPLAAHNVALTLRGDTVTAGGALFAPHKNVKIADVTITHALASGTGAAHLAVPGIVFGEQLQPDDLTRLTFGVIADVKGAVRGEGDIAWSPAGVTSTGTFATDGADLAAAFGPANGIKGTIHFTDLLNLQSAPGQVATIASINPGVPVTDGRIIYQTLPGNRVAVESGRWPFAGGTLTLDPTLLDFTAAQARRLTFHVDGMEAAQFLQQFEFKNLDATGVFDGVLPMVFDDAGGRIEDGRLTVRAGGGTLAYVGDLTEKDLGTWGNIAFQALKSLRYRNLDVVMNGPLAGEMITEVRFAGVSQGQGAKSNFLIRRLQRLPFVFNIRIKAPFRGLLDSAASFYDPRRLIERNLPVLLKEQEKRATPPSIQPPASEKMP